MQIWAPTFRKQVDEQTGEDTRVLRGFMPVTVFDVAQTEGKPIPERIKPELIMDETVLGETLTGYTADKVSPFPGKDTAVTLLQDEWTNRLAKFGTDWVRSKWLGQEEQPAEKKE